MEHGANTTALIYTVQNRADAPCTLQVVPVFQFAPKGIPPQEPRPVRYKDGAVRCGQMAVYVKTTGQLLALKHSHEALFYADDEKDGRAPGGVGLRCCAVRLTVPPGETGRLELVLSAELTDETAVRNMQKILDLLDEDDDVQAVYHNWDE